MAHIAVRFPLTSAVCFVWAQALILSLMVNGI
jgi:hypothetical protein